MLSLGTYVRTYGKENTMSKSKVSEDYEHYLVMLQERNKLLSKLRQKDSQQIELEKKEQGFSLYLNGANLGKSNKTLPTRKGRPKTRQRTSKTAGGSEGFDTAVEPVKDRAMTAPTKRKSWVCDTLELKTEGREALHVPVPEIVSGSYEEDFESPADNLELSLSFQDISALRKSLEKDSAMLTDVNDSPVKNEYCSSDSSCEEELDSPDDCSPPAAPLEEPGIVIEFESESHSIVSLTNQPTTTVKNIVSETTSKQAQGVVCPDLSTLMTQKETITEFQYKEPSKANTATRSLSAIKRKQNKTLPESAQEIIDAVTAENKHMQLDIQSTQPTANKDPILMCDDQTSNTHSLSSLLPNTLCSDHLSNDNTMLHSKQGSPLKDSFPNPDSLSSRNTPKENPLSRFKPVLVNRYKQNHARHSPSLVSQSTVIDEKASDSLTEHTLSVITSKVRKMDASNQRRLLDLLHKLDASALPSPLLTPSTPCQHAPTRSQFTTPLWLESTHTEESRQKIDIAPPPRPCSTRTTGLRSRLNSRGIEEDPNRRINVSRGESKSGRVSQLRESVHISSSSEIFLPSLEYDNVLRSSASNPCLSSSDKDGDVIVVVAGENPSNQTLIRSSFDEDSSIVSPIRPPRLKTATLAKGRRQMANSVVNQMFSDVGSPDNEGNSSTLLPPVVSQKDPEEKSFESDSWKTRSECLESITKFDRSHLGQIKADMQDNILESFLSDHREGKDGHPHSDFHPPDEEFLTPELPSGRELILHILSTWGDRFYVGLTGVEIYTEEGVLSPVEQIFAVPRDINVLSEYDNDPRVVDNLLDGVNQTRDDVHMWLAPFTAGQDHSVTIIFPQLTTISVVRLWNYNKSRIHSTRGARLVKMTLDHQIIFHGEVSRGDNSETILFTTDEDILYLVSQHDTLYQSMSLESGFMEIDPIDDPYRPPTSETNDGNRPMTTATAYCDHNSPSNSPFPEDAQAPELMNKTNPSSTYSHNLLPFGQTLQISLTETWGASEVIGLTGLAILTSGGEASSLQNEQIFCEIDGQRSDINLAVLLNGVNLTCDVEHMWSVPFNSSEPPILTLSLDTLIHVTGLLVWNYNASVEESYGGVKVMHVSLDGNSLTPPGGWLVRRAPGHVEYHYQQLLSFTVEPNYPELPLNGEPFPRGFVFQLQLLSSWGDPYYMGLNELEVCDATGRVIPLTIKNIAAYPDSVNQLPGVQGDLRTPDKLIDGVRGTEDAGHMWLAPILPGVTNNVYVIFNEPWGVSQIKLWNYGKTHSRGVKEMAVLVDGLLVFSGTVPRVPSHARGILPTLQPPLEPFIISLGDVACLDQATTDMSLNDVQFTNNSEVVLPARKPHALVANQDLRPMTSVTIHSNRHKHW